MGLHLFNLVHHVHRVYVATQMVHAHIEVVTLKRILVLTCIDGEESELLVWVRVERRHVSVCCELARLELHLIQLGSVTELGKVGRVAIA